MKNNILKVVFILVVIAILYFLRIYFSEYNIKKTISACVVAQKRTSESFNLEKATKHCEEKIRNQK